MGEVKRLGEADFDAEIKGSLPVVVDFFADWCGPCKMMGPIFEATAPKYEGKIKFAKVNVDEQRKLAIAYKVMSIPTFVFFKDGKEVARHTGGMDEATLQNKLEALL